MIVSRLTTHSRRAMLRLYKPRYCKYRAKMMGKFYRYKPRGSLIKRLASELNLSPSETLAAIQKERVELLKRNHPDVKFQPWEVV